MGDENMGEENMKKKMVVFSDKRIRTAWHNDEWYFSVIDIVFALTESIDAKQYIKKMKQRDFELKSRWGTICTPLVLVAKDGRERLMNCANKEGIFRIIQSIPSKRAEPFKRWLAKVGSERIDEIENPELAQNRAKEYYEKKGYPKDWIEKRLRGIAIRQDLTDEWKNRGVEEKKDYAILTDEISKATFGVSIKEHKRIKGLDVRFKNENLRDNHTDLELIFSMLGEKVATEITREDDAVGFLECEDAALRGGNVAGKARVDAEREIGKSIVSKENYLDIFKENEKKIKKVIKK